MTGYQCIGIRIKAAFLVFCALFGFLIYHLYGVQIRRHDELFGKARAKYTIETHKEGIRGEIFDYDGNMLVGNQPVGSVIADPMTFDKETERREAAAKLAAELELPESEVYKKLNDRKIIVTGKDGRKVLVNRRYVLLKKNIPFSTFERNRLNIHRAKIRGIRCQISLQRVYPKNEMLSNILGFTTIDRDKVIAKSGLEKFYDRDMSSVTGTAKYERSRDGIPLSYGEISSKKEHDGWNLYLTVREPIQAIMEEEIDKMMASSGAVRGYAVMADPYTGDIIGVAQRPTYNPNDRTQLKESTSRNPVAEMAFEPGSIMKPFPVAGALDQGIITPGMRFDCEDGRWFYAGKILRDSHKIGVCTVSDIIQQSSNIGTAKIALEIGEPRLKNILMSFGFGQRTGAPLRPETCGLFYRNTTTKISLTRYCIGQGISASPLQLVRAYCMLANGGYPVKLRFVDRVINSETGEVRKIPVQRGNRIFQRPETAFEIKEMLKRVTQPGGTAKQAAVRGYYVAGKTGTAQKVVNGKYSHEKYTASFVGFIPADKPRFVLLVTCDEPDKKNGYYGGAVAGPYFSSIAGRTLKYMRVPPDEDYEVYDANWKAAEKAERAAKVKLWAKEREERERRKAAAEIRSKQKTQKTRNVSSVSGKKVSRRRVM